MTFRKESLLFYQSETLYVIMIVLCLFLYPTIGLVSSLLFMLPFFVLILVNPKLHNEFITINEDGISCQKAGIQIWAYQWNDVVELKKGSRYLLPSIEIIVNSEQGKSIRISKPNHYFQLGRLAKKAIVQYFKQ